MPRIITFLIAVIFSITLSAQNKSEEKAIKQVISTFFDGLHKGDSTILKSTLHKEIKIQTTFTNKKGEKNLRTQTKENLLKGVTNKKPSDTYFEKLLSYTIKIDGNLASVWTPYEFYLNDKFSHCGANSFQLFNNNGKWEIIYLVDMRRRASCKASNQKK
ncbi:nuclear transport factor 2 family protein [Polaribacter aquimarinus]|uniref:3-methyl-2-oxobutanoate hydroxymethyltransferase n=1 Tax=Polaribacter aquimarinus TaxID=2100726 RepID=A0A2U2JC29_9FLAO|nr:nuclear transport factor 2 family protein [Polaribacter aquimarinus]PWG05872.1 3-methyl-2-oxobutanoate hydroxymethyltransferase [Polaribacter aquimarinus]